MSVPTSPKPSRPTQQAAKVPYEPPVIRPLGSAKDLLASGGASCNEAFGDLTTRTDPLCTP